jgi:hypothetical protein
VPLNGASTLNDSAITLVFVRNKVVVLGGDRWVVVRVRRVIIDGSALLLARNVVVEDTETVATVRVGYVVLELTKLLVLRAHVSIERWANCSLLKIVPVRVTIRAASSIVANNVVRIGDPDGCWSLISIKKRP